MLNFEFAWYWKRNLQTIHYPIFDDLSKFKVSLLHDETSEIGKKYFVGCYGLWLKDGIYAVTNIGVEILMYIQIFILVKAAFSIEGIHQSRLIIKKAEQDKYFDKTNEKYGNYCKYFMG